MCHGKDNAVPYPTIEQCKNCHDSKQVAEKTKEVKYPKIPILRRTMATNSIVRFATCSIARLKTTVISAISLVLKYLNGKNLVALYGLRAA